MLTGHASLLSPSMQMTGVILPLVVMTTLYFGLNSGLAATAIALESDVPIATVCRRLAPLSVNYVAAASAAFCFVIVMRTAGVLAASAVVPLVIVLHVTLRSILGRLSDAEIHVQKVDRLYLSTIETLATAIEAKDGVTHDHIRRVQRFAIGLANALGIHDEDTIKAIKAAALLHDTGKLAVPEHILNKPGKLTPLEFEQMKLHVDVGADILASIDFPYPVVPIVRAHHESWDGSGYPRGLKGDEIPIGARILSVVDCFDALTSDRPYRPALSDDDAMKIVVDRRGTMYDPLVVDTFLKVYREIAAVAMEPVPHQEALSRIGRAISAPQPLPRRPSPRFAPMRPTTCWPSSASRAFSEARRRSATPRRWPRRTCPASCRTRPTSSIVHDAASGRLVARHATGEHAAGVARNVDGDGGAAERLGGRVPPDDYQFGRGARSLRPRREAGKRAQHAADGRRSRRRRVHRLRSRRRRRSPRIRAASFR